jgi:hypothetical protein
MIGQEGSCIYLVSMLGKLPSSTIHQPDTIASVYKAYIYTVRLTSSMISLP